MYPVPSYAAYIWVVGDEINLSLPPLEGHQQGHTVRIPRTDKGINHLLRILQERQTQTRPLNISTPASPTQYQIEEWMRALKKAKPIEAKVDELVTALDDLSIEEIEAELRRRNEAPTN